MCLRCDLTRENPNHPLHCPKCLYCGARVIWRVQRLRIAKEDVIERCRQALADWMERGHSEDELRRLAKQPEMPLEPEAKRKR